MRAWRRSGGRQRSSVFLHVGAMKTGTTFLQHTMLEHRHELLQAGVLFPTEDDQWRLQVDAVRERAGPRIPDIGRDVSGAWERLLAQVSRHRGVSVVSMEFLSFLRPPEARAFVQGLAGADVHVILTVRDARRVIPGTWQTAARNGGAAPWPDYVADLTGDRASSARHAFRRTQGVPRMLRAWSSAVERGHLHVVTVPPPSAPRELLWRRFATAAGFDPDIVTEPATRTNAALGYPSADLIRRVNLSLGDRRGWRQLYRDSAKRVLATGILSQRRSVETPVAADERTAAFGAAWNGRVLTALEAAMSRGAATLVGDPADLPTSPGEDLEVTPAALPAPEELLAAASFALPRMRSRVCRFADGARLPQMDAFLATVPAGERDPRPRWLQTPDPVATAVHDIAEAVRTLTAAKSAPGRA
jgi:hypothetical protein